MRYMNNVFRACYIQGSAQCKMSALCMETVDMKSSIHNHVHAWAQAMLSALVFTQLYLLALCDVNHLLIIQSQLGFLGHSCTFSRHKLHLSS